MLAVYRVAECLAAQRPCFCPRCYWLKDLLPIDPSLKDLRRSCKATQHTIPQIQLAHATATATQGNFATAKTLIQEAKQRDPSLDITQRLTNARRHASSSLIFKAQRRVNLTSRDQLSADPQANLEKFDYLTQAYLNEANFLVRRAVTINPDLNLEEELAKVKQHWQKSIETIKPN